LNNNALSLLRISLWVHSFFLAVRFQLVHLKFELDLIETVTLTNAWPAKRLLKSLSFSDFQYTCPVSGSQKSQRPTEFCFWPINVAQHARRAHQWNSSDAQADVQLAVGLSMEFYFLKKG